MPPSPTHKTNYVPEGLARLTSQYTKQRPGSLITGLAAMQVMAWLHSASGGVSPVVSAIDPPIGPLAGGTAVTIQGANFTGATSVQIGDSVHGYRSCTSLVVVDPNTITCVTPNFNSIGAGAYDVVVTTPGGSGTLSGGFRFVDQALWLRSDLGITLNSGKVSAWADQSGNGNNASQGTANSQPIYTASDANLGGFPSLNPSPNVGAFAHKGMATSSFALGTYTVLFVCCGKNPSGGGAGAGYFFLHQTDASNYSYLWTDVAYSSGIDRASVVTGRNTGINGAGSWADFGTTTAKTVRVEFAGTNASNIIYLNGVAQSMTTAVTGDPGSGTISAAMQLFWDGSSNSGGMKTAEIIVLRGVDAAANTAVEAYLRARYGHY